MEALSGFEAATERETDAFTRGIRLKTRFPRLKSGAAKAVNNSDIYGTAEAVPFLKDRALTQTL